MDNFKKKSNTMLFEKEQPKLDIIKDFTVFGKIVVFLISIITVVNLVVSGINAITINAIKPFSDTQSSLVKKIQANDDDHKLFVTREELKIIISPMQQDIRDMHVYLMGK